MRLFIVSVCALLALAGPAWADWTGSWNLNDNQIPDGWTLRTFNGGPGIASGRLIAAIVDAQSILSAEIIHCPTNYIRMEYDGNLASGGSGFVSGVWVSLSATSFYAYSGHAPGLWGDVHKVRVREGDQNLVFLYDQNFPRVFGTYHYTIEFKDNQISYRGVCLDDGTERFAITVPTPGLIIADVQTVNFDVYTTTGTDCWADNLSVGGLCVLPTENTSWGAVKSLFR